MPVKPLISPLLAFKYRPLTSLASQTSKEALTYTSIKFVVVSRSLFLTSR